MWWGSAETLVEKIRPFLGNVVFFKKQKHICQGDHAGHICRLAQNNDFQQIADAVKDPKYVCLNCGRVASAEKYLCHPLAIEKVSLQVPHMH